MNRDEIIKELANLWKGKCQYGKFAECYVHCNCKEKCRLKNAYCNKEEFEKLSKKYEFTDTGFWREGGCMIPVEERSYICVTFLCGSVLREMTQKERNRYSKLIKQLKTV